MMLMLCDLQVVATHVLCSVDDIDAVLAQVSRALKPGGTYHFMEHVATQEKYTTMWALQMVGNHISYKQGYYFL